MSVCHGSIAWHPTLFHRAFRQFTRNGSSKCQALTWHDACSSWDEGTAGSCGVTTGADVSTLPGRDSMDRRRPPSPLAEVSIPLSATLNVEVSSARSVSFSTAASLSSSRWSRSVAPSRGDSPWFRYSNSAFWCLCQIGRFPPGRFVHLIVCRSI